MSLSHLLFVGFGGFLGSTLRYSVNELVVRFWPLAIFPFATLIVNGAGSLVLGALAGLSEGRELFSPGIRLFLFVGCLGGFTTFSSFAWETVHLAHGDHFGRALANVGLQVGVGLLAAAGGFWGARSLF